MERACAQASSGPQGARLAAGLALPLPAFLEEVRARAARPVGLPAEAFEVYEQLLEPRSAYVLAGEARHGWQHSIPAVEVERWSITFRTLKRRPPD